MLETDSREVEMRGDGRVTGPTCVPVPATFDYRVVHSAINERTNPLQLINDRVSFTWNMNHIQIIFKSLIIFKIKPAKQNDVFLPRSSTHYTLTHFQEASLPLPNLLVFSCGLSQIKKDTPFQDLLYSNLPPRVHVASSGQSTHPAISSRVLLLVL